MSPLVCSTSLCPLPDAPVALLTRWEELAKQLLDAPLLALDPRLDAELQRELLRLGRTRDLRCYEVAHPFRGPCGAPAATPISQDRDEQLACREQLSRTLQRAADHGAAQVSLYPAALELSLTPAAMKERFALGLSSGLDQLQAERAERTAALMDALCLVLDAVLRQADRLTVDLVLPTPAPWPHWAPATREVLELLQIFEGARLKLCHAVDWEHVAGVVAGDTEIAPSAPQASCFRLADACGFSAMLPLGTGEIDWSRARRPATGEQQDLSVLVSVRADTTSAEMRAGQQVLSQWLSTRQSSAQSTAG